MLQATKNKYTVETLKPLNILYDHEHRLTQQDVDMANGYVELIERTRSEKIPQVGDRLIYVDRYGKYYGNALIMKILKTMMKRAVGFPSVNAVFDDMRPDAVKIGMLHSREIIETVAKRLSFYKPAHVVLDPVMISTSGNRLINENAIIALKTKTIPACIPCHA